MNDNLRRAGGFHSAPLSSKGTLTVGTIAPRTTIFLPTPKPPLHWRSDTCGLDYTGRPIQSHQLQKKHVVVKWQNTVSMTMPDYSSVNATPGVQPDRVRKATAGREGETEREMVGACRKRLAIVRFERRDTNFDTCTVGDDIHWALSHLVMHQPLFFHNTRLSRKKKGD